MFSYTSFNEKMRERKENCFSFLLFLEEFAVSFGHHQIQIGFQCTQMIDGRFVNLLHKARVDVGGIDVGWTN